MNNVEEIVNTHVNECRTDFESGSVSYPFSLLFNDGLIDYDVEILRVDVQYIVICYDYISFLKSLNESIKFVNIPHLTTTIKTGLNQMTKSYYLKMKKPMIEWTFLKKNITLYQTMETMYDVSYYSNKLDFTVKADDGDSKNLSSVKRKLVDQFEDYNISKPVDVLSIVDNLVVTLMSGNLQDISIKTDTLRKNNI